MILPRLLAWPLALAVLAVLGHARYPEAAVVLAVLVLRAGRRRAAPGADTEGRD